MMHVTLSLLQAWAVFQHVLPRQWQSTDLGLQCSLAVNNVETSRENIVLTQCLFDPPTPPTPNRKTAQHRDKRAIKVPFCSANLSTALFNSQIRTSELLLNHPAVLYRSQSFVLEEPVICYVQFPRTKKLPLENVLQLLYKADSPAYFYQWNLDSHVKSPFWVSEAIQTRSKPTHCAMSGGWCKEAANAVIGA